MTTKKTKVLVERVDEKEQDNITVSVCPIEPLAARIAVLSKKLKRIVKANGFSKQLKRKVDKEL
jgi:hypothetical protein